MMNKVEKVSEVLFREVLNNFPIPCVDIVVECRKTNLFLLLQRKEKPAQGEWWFPGGRLYRGETLLDCVKRKLLEEVSITKYHSVELVGTYETFFEDGPFEGTQSHTINVTFSVLIDDPEGEFKQNEQFFSDYRWVKGDESFICDYVKKRIDEAIGEW